MVRKITIEENETIEVNGAVLTPNVIKQIKSFQECENEFLKSFREYLAETICFMVTEATDYHGIDKESRKEHLLYLSASLSYARNYLSDLQKPELPTSRIV